MIRYSVKPEAHNAILAGLRLLQKALENGTVKPDDGGIGSVLTNAGEQEALTVEEIDELVERIA